MYHKANSSPLPLKIYITKLNYTVLAWNLFLEWCHILRGNGDEWFKKCLTGLTTTTKQISSSLYSSFSTHFHIQKTKQHILLSHTHSLTKSQLNILTKFKLKFKDSLIFISKETIYATVLKAGRWRLSLLVLKRE